MGITFLVDGMLGGLARWLRILGEYAEFDAHSTDNELLAMAETKHMVLLTRDEELYHRGTNRRISCLLVQGKNEPERLAEVGRAFNLKLEVDMSTTKCPECGGELQKVSKAEAGSSVPQASLRAYDDFWQCSTISCGKIYWMGSHWRQIHNTLDQARQLLANKS